MLKGMTVMPVLCPENIHLYLFVGSTKNMKRHLTSFSRVHINIMTFFFIFIAQLLPLLDIVTQFKREL